jgi:hypothetical protein
MQEFLADGRLLVTGNSEVTALGKSCRPYAK